MAVSFRSYVLQTLRKKGSRGWVLPSVLCSLVTASPVTHQSPAKASITGIKEKKIRQSGRGNSVKKGRLCILKNTVFGVWLRMVGGVGAGRVSAGRPPDFQKPNVKVELVWMRIRSSFASCAHFKTVHFLCVRSSGGNLFATSLALSEPPDP